MQNRRLELSVLGTLLLSAHAFGQLDFQNQTVGFSPYLDQSMVPYNLAIELVELESSTNHGVHSSAIAALDGKLLFIGGRSTGMHDFACQDESFPAADFNSSIYVLDYITNEWSYRLLSDASSGLTGEEQAELSATNSLHTQDGEHLLMAGGYGYNTQSAWVTFTNLKVIDIAGVVGWVSGDGSVLSDHIDFVVPPANAPAELAETFFRLTGGELIHTNNEYWLCLGQSFMSGYNVGCSEADPPPMVQEYSRSIRGFTLDHTTSPPTANATFYTHQEPEITEGEPGYYGFDDWARRRDLNIVEARIPNGERGAVALAGVFLPEPLNGIWTLPIVIGSGGSMTMDDPASPTSFKQGFNAYHGSTISFWSESRGENWFNLLGGLGYHVLRDGVLTVAPSVDYSNQMLAVKYAPEDNSWSQHLMDSSFPHVVDPYGAQLFFGTEMLVFPLVELDEHGMYDLDSIEDNTPIALLYGGITSAGQTGSNASGNATYAGYRLFTVTLNPAKQPCDGDLNGDGLVNSFDVSFILVAWGDVPAGATQPADLDNNGVVNGTDLGLLLYQWGQCP
jgi:hypothetical protein